MSDAASTPAPSTPPAATACEKAVESALTRNRYIKYMISSMKALGCDVENRIQPFVRCVDCNDETVMGNFQCKTGDPSSGIVLCGDNVDKFKLSNKMIERTVLHELVHAYDACRVEFDPNDCRQIACTEIRAAHLSGDCEFSAELNRGFFKVGGQGVECIKRRAELSLSGHKHCAEKAKETMDECFEACYNDTAPYLRKH